MILRGNTDTNILIERNRTVQRLAVNVRVETTSGSGLQRPLLKHVQLKCMLRRDKKEIMIFNTNLQALALESMFFQACESLLHPTYLYQLNTTGTSWGQNLIIDLKSPINLTGRDELSLEMTMSPSWLPTLTGNAFIPANCTLEMVWREMIGVEVFIPQINTKYIQAGIGSVDESLGDDITSIAFINTEGFPVGGNSLNDTTKIINTLTLTTDRYNINDTFERMLARRATQFESLATEKLRYRSFVIMPEGEVDNCKLSLNLQATNVVASENLLVWRTYVIDKGTISRAAAMNAKHEERNTQKIQAQL